MNINSLKAIMLSIAQAQSIEIICQQIVSGVAEASDVALVRLWLVTQAGQCNHCVSQGMRNDPTRALHMVASAGHSKSGDVDYSSVGGSSHRIGLGVRKIGKIAQTGEAMLIPDASADQSWVVDPEWFRREEIQSFAGQPLIFRGEVLGVLAVFGRTKFSDDENQWLRTFADHAAVAIWNRRTIDELADLKAALESENEYLHKEIKEVLHYGEIIGQSNTLKKVLQQVELVAETEATVLILGESGTGKELVARAIHARGNRRGHPLIKVNCGAISDELFESEFFGHVKGSFTGAIKDRLGRFELANGGDIFLDEVGEIPLSLQAKLLRVLQEKQFERVGDTRTRSLDVRIIAATNRDLEKEVEAGRFREDLYYRLSVFPIKVPPLRKRIEDIVPLARHFLAKGAARMKIDPPRLTQSDILRLQEYEWPGNVRELENAIERATILSKNSGVLDFSLPAQGGRIKSRSAPLSQPPAGVLKQSELKSREMENILAALEACHGRIFGGKGAAQMLGVPPTTLASRLKALGLKKTFRAADAGLSG